MEEKPYFFTGRSGNAQIGVKTYQPDVKIPPCIENEEVSIEGRIENFNPLLGNVLELFKKGDEIGRLVVMDPELRIHDVRHYLHKRLFVGREISKGYYEGLDPFRTFRDRQVELLHFGGRETHLSSIKVKIRFFRSKNPLTVPLEKNKVKDGYCLCDLLTNAEVSNLFNFIDKTSLGMILNKGNFVQIPKAFIMSVGIAIDLEGEHQASLTTCDGLIKYKEGLRLARQDHIQKLSNLPIINTGGYGSAEELAITITSMKIHENPLAPIVLLDPDNLWEDAQKQAVKIAHRKYGPDFIPNLILPCRNADDALTGLTGFLTNPDKWYEGKSIPRESIEISRIKSKRIRREMLYQENIEVFDKPGYPMSA